MKKLVLSLLACGSIAATNAQGILMYGSLAYSNKNDRDISIAGTGSPEVTLQERTNSLSFKPGVGFMVNDHFAVGLQFMAIGSKVHTETDPASSEVDDRNFTIEIGPFARWTNNIGDHFFWYGQFEAGYQGGKHKVETTPSSYDPVDKYDGFMVNLYPAIGIHITKCMALATSYGGLGYDYLKTTFDQGQTPPAGASHDGKVSNLNFTFGQEMDVTVQWTFGGGSHHMTHHEPMDDTRDINTSDDDDNSNRKKRHSNDDE